jgi:hypothetical protein
MKKFLVSIILSVTLVFFYGCASSTTLNYKTVGEGMFFKAYKANNYDPSKTIAEHSSLIILQSRTIEKASLLEYISVLELNGEPVIIGQDEGLTINNIAVLQSGTHKVKVRCNFTYNIVGGGDRNSNYDTELNFTFQPGKHYQLRASLHPDVVYGQYNVYFSELSSANYNPARDIMEIKDTSGTATFVVNKIPLYSVVDGIDAAIKRDIQ